MKQKITYTKNKLDSRRSLSRALTRDGNDRLNQKPLVSVVMPVFNAEKYLAEAIESILNQTYQNFEFIIVDDASTDNSWQVVSNYQKQYQYKIKAIRLTKNLNKGGDACANVGISKTRGEFIARMDADDIAHPKRLEKQVAYLQKNPDVLIVGTQAYVIDQKGKVTGKKQVPSTHKEIYRNYAVFHPMIHPTVMIRMPKMPKRQEFYRIKYSANNDLLTFFELLNKGKFANLASQLHYYRVHGANDSLTKPKERFFNTLKIRIAAIRRFGYRPSIKAIIINSMQTVAILILPEKLILPVYLYIKGISKPSIRPLILPFVRIRRYVYSLL